MGGSNPSVSSSRFSVGKGVTELSGRLAFPIMLTATQHFIIIKVQDVAMFHLQPVFRREGGREWGVGYDTTNTLSWPAWFDAYPLPVAFNRVTVIGRCTCVRNAKQ